ncbi:putative transcription factor WRKY family [Helianthus annuus]|nr:putative transcription factor WRKY family [Helianthus annuus]
MESFLSWPESLPSRRTKALQELRNGKVFVDKLQEMLGRPEKIEFDLQSDNGVVVQMMGMFDNALSVYHSSNLNGNPHNPTNNVRSPRSWDDQKAKDYGKSNRIVTPVKTKRGCYNRRKSASTIVKMTSTLIDDGYAWRKYGQKTILNSKHQRNYYRCSHKFEQGCQATKQVQKTDRKPSNYKITYYGHHTCNNLQRAPQIYMEDLDLNDNSFLISFGTNTPMGNNKVGTCFPPVKYTPKPKENRPSLGSLKHEQVSSFNYHTPYDPIIELSQVPSEPMSVISYALDCDDMVSSGAFSSPCSTHGYEIDDINENHEYADFLFDLW